MSTDNITIMIKNNGLMLFEGNLYNLKDTSSSNEISYNGHNLHIVTEPEYGNYMQVFCETLSFEECQNIHVIDENFNVSNFLKLVHNHS